MTRAQQYVCNIMLRLDKITKIYYLRYVYVSKFMNKPQTERTRKNVRLAILFFNRQIKTKKSEK